MKPEEKAIKHNEDQVWVYPNTLKNNKNCIEPCNKSDSFSYKPLYYYRFFSLTESQSN